MKKGKLSNTLRKLRLLYFADSVSFYIRKIKTRKENKEFLSKNPEVKLPPDYLMYESFQINYRKYFKDGAKVASEIAERFKKHTELKDKKILDWGCGPGRIIRHLPEVINNGCQFYGTDYNKKSIEWCSENLKGIQFNHNKLEANLPYEDNFFDIIYGLSIFTHLSEKMHFDWFNELKRILKPGGIMYITTQGKHFKVKLSQDEIVKFNNNELVVRGNVLEGHRTYSAFHPEDFMKKLFKEVEILEHIVTPVKSKSWLPQDIWIVKK